MLRGWAENPCVITGFRHRLQPKVFGCWRALGLLESVSLGPVCLLFSIKTLVVDMAGIYSTSNSISLGYTHIGKNSTDLENPARKRKKEMRSG